MKKYLSKIIVLFFLASLSKFCIAQEVTAIPFTADSLESGNYKDVLSGFFKLAIDHLTGPDKELSFTANPFAVLAKMNNALLVDTNYYKYRSLRNLNFSFALRLDDDYHFTGFSSGISYAIINRKDYTVSRGFLEAVSNKEEEFTRLNDERNSFAATITDPALKAKWTTQINSFFTDSAYAFNKMDADVQKLFIQLATANNEVHIIKLLQFDPNTSFKKVSQQNYDSIVNNFQNKHLLTVGISDTAGNENALFKKLVFSAESTKGFLDPSRAVNLEWDIKAASLFTNDSTGNPQNLNRTLLYAEPGINIVFKNKATQKSFVECKLSGEYNHVFKNRYADERKDSLTLNAILRIRILNDVWIPLQIKYDPRSGKVFGFLNVRFNFFGINKKEQTVISKQ